MAFSTSAAATANTASEPPMIVKRRCLRVMRGLCCCASCSSIEPEILQALVQLPQSLGVVAVLLQSAGEAFDHAMDQRAAVGLAHVFCRGYRVVRQRRSAGAADPG